MPSTPSNSAADDLSLVAFQRFGLGAKLGGFARIGPSPKLAVRSELNKPGIALINDTRLPSYVKAAFDSASGFERAEAVRRRELDARVDKHLSVEIGFVERLVLFWSNHFSMSIKKSASVRGTIGQFERAVIRAHALGNFPDMLKAAIRHPAMISFLDNDSSVGPGSPLGYKKRVSYTENLAREILELHTVGTGSYREADVAALAKMLTGWSVVRSWEADRRLNGGNNQNRGQFIFRPDWHEQGPIKFMGRVYPDEGRRQAERAILRLARHPSTAEHLARKLVRHFITDNPTNALVGPVKQAFIRSGGNLKAVAIALLDLPGAWDTTAAKIRTPYEISIAQFRAVGRRYDTEQFASFTGALRALHQLPWEAPSPEGYPDDTLHWLTPDAMVVRVDSAQRAARMYFKQINASVPNLVAGLFGDTLSAATRQRIAEAGDNPAALTVLFCSPEFQRR